MAINLTYVTDEGKAFASIVRRNIQTYVGDNDPVETPTYTDGEENDLGEEISQNTSEDDATEKQCSGDIDPDVAVNNTFAVSNNKEIRNRASASKASYAYHLSLKEYVCNYGVLTSTTTGMVNACPTTIRTITEADDFELQGRLNLSNQNNVFFTMYNIPNIFGLGADDGDTDAPHRRTMKRSLKAIKKWMIAPVVRCTVNGFKLSVYVTGEGIFKLTIDNDGIDEIIDKAITEFDSITAYVEDNPDTSTVDVFNAYHDVYGTAVVEMLNINTVSTIDGGIGIFPDCPGAPYVGTSSGSVAFGSTMVVAMDVTVPVPPEELTLTVQAEVDMEPVTMCFENPSGDESCYEYTIAPSSCTEDSEPITPDTLTSILIEKLNGVALSIYNKIQNRLKDKLREIEEDEDLDEEEKERKIVEAIADASEQLKDALGKLSDQVSSVTTAVTDKIAGFFEAIVDEVIRPLLRAASKIAWEAVTTVYAPIDALFQSIQALDTIDNITKINDNIDALNESIEVVADVVEEINDVVTDASQLDNIDFGLDGVNSCMALTNFPPPIPIPTLPVPPSLPSLPLPEVPEVIECDDDNKDVDGNDCGTPPAMPIPNQIDLDDTYVDLVPVPEVPVPEVPAPEIDTDVIAEELRATDYYPSYGASSLRRLATCDTDIQEIFDEVINYIDIGVTCGFRNKEDQNAAYASGASTLLFPRGKHNSQPSRAIDVMVYTPGIGYIQNDNKGDYRVLANIVFTIAQERNINIRWGGDWDGDGDMTDQTLHDVGHFEIRG